MGPSAKFFMPGISPPSRHCSYIYSHQNLAWWPTMIWCRILRVDRVPFPNQRSCAPSETNVWIISCSPQNLSGWLTTARHHPPTHQSMPKGVKFGGLCPGHVIYFQHFKIVGIGGHFTCGVIDCFRQKLCQASVVCGDDNAGASKRHVVYVNMSTITQEMNSSPNDLKPVFTNAKMTNKATSKNV